MKAVIICLFIGLTLGCVFDRYTESNKRAAHWSYSGDTGPSNWASLDPAYATCGSGRKQTPVALVEAETEDYPIGDISVNAYNTSQSVEVENNGHTVVVFVEDGAVTGGPLFSDEYSLLQFHWHTPSEHTLNGLQYPLEVHFVHNNTNTGDLSVVGVFFEIGEHNEWLATFFDDLPNEEGEIVVQDDVDPYGGLPEDLSFMHYMGSLTTPPCSEGLKWIVLDKVLELSEEQLAQFQSVFSFNARPVQPLNGRTVWQNEDEECPTCPQPTPCPEAGETVGTQINFNFGGLIPSK